MKVLVMGRNDAVTFSTLTEWIPSIIISIRDPGSKTPKFKDRYWIKGIEYLQFADEEKGHPQCITYDDANRIKNLILDYKDDIQCIVVHCEAGVSRSSGIAAAILNFFKEDENQIWKHKRYVPNRTCYRTMINSFNDIKE